MSVRNSSCFDRPGPLFCIWPGNKAKHLDATPLLLQGSRDDVTHLSNVGKAVGHHSRTPRPAVLKSADKELENTIESALALGSGPVLLDKCGRGLHEEWEFRAIA